MKIKTRILLGFLIIYIAGFYFLVDFIINEIRPRYLETVEESLNDTANIFASLLESDSKNGRINTKALNNIFPDVLNRNLSAKIFGIIKTSVNLHVYVTDAKGKVLYDSNDKRNIGRDYSRWNDVHLTLKGKYGARSSSMIAKDPSTNSLYVAAPIRYKNKIIGVVTVVKPQDSITLFIELAKKKIIIAGILTCSAFIILSFLISLWIGRPITKLINYVKSLKEDRRSGLPSLGGPEIKNLGRAFENLWEELRGKKYIEEYIQTLTHELKSPLSSIRGAAELMMEDMPQEQKNKFCRNILTESGRVENIIEKLLELSAVESKKHLENPENININALVQEIVDGFSPQIARKRMELQIIINNDDNFIGDKFLLRQAVSNLLQNAIQFTPDMGEIIISSKKDDKFISLSICDNGPGIPAFALDKVFDKFYSLPSKDKQKSSGLGLTFVKEVALLHGGGIEVKNNFDNGVTAVLQLPIS